MRSALFRRFQVSVLPGHQDFSLFFIQKRSALLINSSSKHCVKSQTFGKGSLSLR